MEGAQRGGYATMADTDNVLLLRPVTARSGFPALAARTPAGSTRDVPSRLLVTLYTATGPRPDRDRPFDPAFADFFDRQARPVLTEAGATSLACLQTEHAENTFPGLPVRAGENVFISAPGGAQRGSSGPQRVR